MSDAISFQWGPGLQKFMEKIKNGPIKMKLAVPKVLFQEGEELMSAAKPLTPVDHGNLRASGHVDLPTFDGDSVSVKVGFGGVAGSGNQGGETNDESVGYAVHVHENLDLHHKVGQAKFLETPFDQRKDGMAERLADRIQTELNRAQ